jgi:hypothetical protein
VGKASATYKDWHKSSFLSLAFLILLSYFIFSLFISDGLSIFLVTGYIPGTLFIPSSKEYYVPAKPDYSIMFYFFVVV